MDDDNYTPSNFGFCNKCGSPLLIYKHKRKEIHYNMATGTPVEYDESYRCSVNPCHQGHIYSKSDNKILSFIIKWFFSMSIGELMECEICGKKKVEII